MKTLSQDIQGVSVEGDYQQFPASPTLLKSLPYILGCDLNEYIKKRDEFLAVKNTTVSIHSNLRNYQNQDAVFLMSLTSKGVFNQQRVGKTPTTLVSMREKGELNNIIIAPGSTIYSWKEEYEKWHQGPVKVLTSNINKRKRKEIEQDFEGTLIMSYGIASNDYEQLLKRNVDAIVVDEAHRLRNFKGQRSRKSPKMTKAIHKLSRVAKGRYALTGTPVPNHPANIYGILAYLFPTFFTSYWKFVEYYFQIDEQIINANRDTVRQVGKFKNAQREAELVEFIEFISIQRKRKDVMKWLEEAEPRKIKIPLSNKQDKYLDEFHEYFEIEGTDVMAINTLGRMIKERQLANDPRLVGLKEVGTKTEWLNQYMKDYPEKSVIIVSQFRKYLELLQKETGSSALLVGGNTDLQKHQIETDFNNKKFQYLFAQIDTAKEGMKLHGADVMIFLDRTLTYTDNEQMADRLLPTTKEIASEKELQEIIYLITDSVIENYIDHMLRNKKSETDIINNYYKR